MHDDTRQVIKLRLVRVDDMFEMPQSDLFSEYRNFLTGIDFCVSELRSRRSGRPVRLEIALPPSEIDEGLVERIRRTLRRYCDHRMSYNRREGRAVQLDGATALRIGLPLTGVGLAVAAIAAKTGIEGDPVRLVADHLGWVLAWVGLWFPLDQMVFSPVAFGRENRVLRLLREADVVIEPYRAAALGSSE